MPSSKLQFLVELVPGLDLESHTLDEILAGACPSAELRSLQGRNNPSSDHELDQGKVMAT
jgi:hypothetical protein